MLNPVKMLASPWFTPQDLPTGQTPEQASQANLTPALPSSNTALLAQGQTSPLTAGLHAAPKGGALSQAHIKPPAIAAKEGAVFSRPERSSARTSTEFDFDFGWQAINAEQEIWVPLPAGQPHVIELEYQDARRTGDLLFSVRKKGTHGPYVSMRGDELWPKRAAYELKTNEKGEPWIENPVRVAVDIIYPDGGSKSVHHVGRKFVDPHMQDAYDVDSMRTPEVDNIFTGYGAQLPNEQLPPGCFLRMTVQKPNEQPWEKGKPALKLSYVRPQVMPPYAARKVVYTAQDTDPGAIQFEGTAYAKPPAKGFKLPLDPGRKVSAVLVRWTDQGGPYSGRLNWQTSDGAQHQSQSYWIGSGETELIPLDNTVPKDGIIHIGGSERIRVHSIEVLYAR